jgi:hypothetical protein
MRIVLQVNKEKETQLNDDLERLKKEIVFPTQFSSWEVENHSINSWNHAETIWNKKRNEAEIKFFNRYFEGETWEDRITTLLHELAHAFLFSTEAKYLGWFDKRNQLKSDRFKKELKEMRYNNGMACWISDVLYPMILDLPLEFLAEEYFKQTFSDFFHLRKEAFFNLRNEWESSFKKWRKETKWNGSQFVAPYQVYVDLLRISHFLKIIEEDDLKNLSRFKKIYRKRKRLLTRLCDKKLLNYFTGREEKLTTVTLSPLYFSEEGFIELSNELWSFPRTMGKAKKVKSEKPNNKGDNY